MNYCILGPHPAHHSYSIVKYFDFYRQNLPRLLGQEVASFCPGCVPQVTGGILPNQLRLRTLCQNYVAWPCNLLKLSSGCFHIVDQGLMWYSNFLRGGKRLGTVHDLIAYMNSVGTLPLPPRSATQKALIRENARQLRNLDHIISVSGFTADCMMRELGIPHTRISVIPNHVDSHLAPLSSSDRVAHRQKWFGDAPVVIIHVGRPLVYKNRLGVVKSFGRLLSRLPEARLFLVGGAPAPDERDFLTGVNWASSVSFIPPVTNEGLKEIYGAADALVFPSLYEGFGWPPIEAMACGCPVVSSTCASLREVVGDAALTVEDPSDHAQIAALLIDILKNRQLAADLRCRGLARARLFSADRALNAVAEVYRKME